MWILRNDRLRDFLTIDKCLIYCTLNYMYEILKTDNFIDWYSSQSISTKLQIDARLQRLVDYGHIGNSRHLSSSLFEMKWKNGLRIYFMFKGKQVVILLAGGTKHGQERDIQRAKKLKESLED